MSDVQPLQLLVEKKVEVQRISLLRGTGERKGLRWVLVPAPRRRQGLGLLTNPVSGAVHLCPRS